MSRPIPKDTEGIVQVQRMGSNANSSRLFELVVDPSTAELAFAESASAKTRKGFAEGQKWVVPPSGLVTFLDTGALQLPTQAVRGKSTAELIEAIKSFIGRYAAVPDNWLSPIAHYILMTWVYDRLTALPYLRFLGESGTGKTRMLEICQALCYRALMVSGTISGAGIFRSVDLVRGTLLVDEGDFQQSEAWSDIVKVFNNGYTPGKAVIRCNNEKNFAAEAFYVYGPKVLSTRQRFDDNALERRCLTFETGGQTPGKDVPLQLPAAFWEEALPLRNKLLGWRFDQFGNIAVDQSQLRNLEPAIAQIGMSLLAVSPDEQSKSELVTFLTEYAEESQADSPKGILARIIADLQALGIQSQTCGQLANKMNHDALKQGLSTKYTAHKVGSIVRALGYKPEHTRNGSVVNFARTP